MNRLLVGLIVLVVMLVIVGICVACSFQYTKEDIAQFIKDHPDKAAIYVVRNDTVIAQQHPDRMMPLASTVKIILAIEYAEQAGSGTSTPKR